jgi:hypothetical protein
VRQRPGIANDINEQCTAACLTSNGSGYYISAPPRWGLVVGAVSRRSPDDEDRYKSGHLGRRVFRAGAAPCRYARAFAAPMPDKGGPETAYQNGSQMPTINQRRSASSATPSPRATRRRLWKPARRSAASARVYTTAEAQPGAAQGRQVRLTNGYGW